MRGCPVCFSDDPHQRIQRSPGQCQLCHREVSFRTIYRVCLTCQAEENLALERQVAHTHASVQMLVGAVTPHREAEKLREDEFFDRDEPDHD